MLLPPCFGRASPMDAIWSDLLRQRYIRLLPLLTRDAITRGSFCRSDFGVIGIAAFTYGRKKCLVAANGHRARADRVSVFVSETWLLYAIGLALCGALYIWRD